jgi:hypothetical protein
MLPHGGRGLDRDRAVGGAGHRPGRLRRLARLAPLLLAGALARAGFIELGPSFRFIARNRALVLFGAATLVEIVGDKFPAVDHTLDALSTVLRPAAGTLLAASVMWQVSDPLTASRWGRRWGAPSALVPHAAKSLLRAGSTALTAAWPTRAELRGGRGARRPLHPGGGGAGAGRASLLLLAFLVVRRSRAGPSAVSAT